MNNIFLYKKYHKIASNLDLKKEKDWQELNFVSASLYALKEKKMAKELLEKYALTFLNFKGDYKYWDKAFSSLIFLSLIYRDLSDKRYKPLLDEIRSEDVMLDPSESLFEYFSFLKGDYENSVHYYINAKMSNKDIIPAIAGYMILFAHPFVLEEGEKLFEHQFIICNNYLKDLLSSID